MTTALSIQQTAEATGVSVHTLRYYERIGLIGAVPRRSNGHRIYRKEELVWIEFLVRLRSTGMPIREMRRYAQLRAQGNRLGSVLERKAMLERHALALEAELSTLTKTLAMLHAKVALYSDIEAGLTTHTDKLTDKGIDHGKRNLRKRIKTAEGSR